MEIPRIIHQTWKDDHIPDELERLAETWRYHHPEWEYRLWTDTQNKEFIEKSFPTFLERYEKFPHHIQRVDAVRYFILYTFGGLYVDLDFECIRPLEILLKEEQCLFGLEPEVHCRIHGKDQIIGNALMATVPGHPFFGMVIEELFMQQNPTSDSNTLVLETTGPFMLGRIYHQMQTGVTLLPSKYFYPLTIYDIEQSAGKEWSPVVLSRLKQAHAVHYHMGSWWRNGLIR